MIAFKTNTNSYKYTWNCGSYSGQVYIIRPIGSPPIMGLLLITSNTRVVTIRVRYQFLKGSYFAASSSLIHMAKHNSILCATYEVNNDYLIPLVSNRYHISRSPALDHQLQVSTYINIVNIDIYRQIFDKRIKYFEMHLRLSTVQSNSWGSRAKIIRYLLIKLVLTP